MKKYRIKHTPQTPEYKAWWSAVRRAQAEVRKLADESDFLNRTYRYLEAMGEDTAADKIWNLNHQNFERRQELMAVVLSPAPVAA